MCSQEEMLSIRGLSVDVAEKTVIKNVTLDISAGEVHLLLGPNGSGKTSLLMTIMGYPQYRITGGGIFFMGRDLSECALTERARLGIGMAEQRPPAINGVTLRMLLEYISAANPEQKSEIDSLVKTANMEAFLTRDINGGLSGGEIKKSEILLLLARKPLFAMLDEPDSGVDIDSLELLSAMINSLFSPDMKYPAKRRTGLIISHSRHILESVHADKAHVMLDGQIVCSGNPHIVVQRISDSGFDACAACKKK